MKVSYAPTGFEAYGEEEIEAVSACLRKGWLGVGELVAKFEEQIAARFGRPHAVMVNSGSSANLLATEEIRAGMTIATPALTFPTTLAYLPTNGKLMLVDVEEGTYQIDFSQMNAEPDALMVPNLLGNLPNWSNAPSVEVCIEDSCDTIPTISSHESDIVTTSFYASHVITACGGGGMIMSDDADRASRFRIKRAWGRPLVDEADLSSRFGYIDGIRYDKKYSYEMVGYNFQPLEVQAAFGLVQLRKLDEFLEIRRRHFNRLLGFFTRYEELFVLPQTRGEANWLAFPLTIREGIDRFSFVQYLEEKGIQTRPIFAGNITRQPAFEPIFGKQEFPVADKVMRGGILLGCHHGLTDSQLDYLEERVTEYLKGPYSQKRLHPRSIKDSRRIGC